MRPAVTLISALLATPAFAISGNAPPASGFAVRSLVMLVDSRGGLCTGTAIARDLVLTAAHCVARPATYRVRLSKDGGITDVEATRSHPGFNMANYVANRATADVALVKLKTPLPLSVVPAALGGTRRVTVGETMIVAGFGAVRDNNETGIGQPRMAPLVVTGQPGSLQIRLQDPATRNASAGLGSCTGDSGGPAFGRKDADDGEVMAVVSWSTAPKNEAGCGGLTGLTPLLNYRAWIVDTAAKLGSPLAP
ncbi:S1 family peptidase [Undibacter mobilis]|uniref:S1 family peptidase n=1 Tax=Undibacter mobilis TaxID=2292256 RepID=A0A371B3I2_9BRAD|nr:trypsin-like serine protease [Undibacter mobilis]RDV02148.1 S1 family peptidase [Undibacter mobilis]